MKIIVALCLLALAVSAKENRDDKKSEDTKQEGTKKDKRSYLHGYGDYAAGVLPLQAPAPIIPQQQLVPVPHFHFPHVHRPTLHVLPPPGYARHYPVAFPHNHIPVAHPVPHPVPVPVERHVPVPVPQPVPYPVHVVRSVAVPVDRPVAVPVDRPVPYPVLKHVHVPYPVDRPVAVPVLRNVPVPFPHPVPVDRPVAVPVDRPVAVPFDRPFAVPVDRPVPVPVDRPVAVPVPFPQPIPQVPVVLENSRPNSFIPPNNLIPNQNFLPRQNEGGVNLADTQKFLTSLNPPANLPNLPEKPVFEGNQESQPPYHYPRPFHTLHTHRIVTHHFKPSHEIREHVRHQDW